MKKSLVALAVLAASGAAMAQSSVTLYGIADIWLGSLKDSQVAANPESKTLLESGGVSTSRWGMKGSEDLGGGLKAIFTLESKIGLDTGTSAGFSRLSYVGLEGDFGTVTFGKMWTAMDDVMGVSNSGFDSGLSATNGVWAANSVYSGNPGNSIKYASPSMGGFNFAATYGLDEAANVSNDMMDFSVSYAGGPLTANFAYQVQKDSTADDLKITTLNGSYDFAVAKLLASYAQTKLGTEDIKDYQIGVDVPLSAALTLSAGYAHSKRNAAAAAGLADGTGAVYAGRENSGYSVAASYSLSKRTSVYGGISRASGENAAGADVSKRQLFAVGMRHAF
jgi:predicted porin